MTLNRPRSPECAGLADHLGSPPRLASGDERPRRPPGRALRRGSHLLRRSRHSRAGRGAPEIEGADEPVAELGFYSVPQTDIPLITAVQGGAWGLGFYGVCASDICVAAEGARFAMPEIPTGIIGPPLFPILNNLPWLPGSEIVIRGHQFDAQRAYELGLVNRRGRSARIDRDGPRRGDRRPALGPRARDEAAADDGAAAAERVPDIDRLPTGDGGPPQAR